MNSLARVCGAALLSSTVLGGSALAADGRQPGSVLIYPVHRSGTYFTIISVTNSTVGSGGDTDVRFNYVNVVPNPSNPFQPLTCFISDRQEALTASDTLSVLTSCHNAAGNQEGYVVVSAQDPSEADTNWSHNFLLGSELVVTSLGGIYGINAIPFESPLPKGTDTDLDMDTEIDFDGFEYECVPRPIYIDSFVAAAGSSLALLNLTGGINHVVSLKMDIFNDNEFQLSATRDFKCWFEEPLSVLSPVFSDTFLALNTPNDPSELDLNCDNVDELETGWAIVCADIACSPAQCCPDPALLGAITAGPAALGNIDGGRLLWEALSTTCTGDFLKFGNVDPECGEDPCPPESIPTCAFNPIGPAVLSSGVEVTFDASASMPDQAPGGLGTIVDYCWRFNGGPPSCSASPMISTTFDCPACPADCQVTVELTVTDDEGCTATCTQVFPVNCVGPVCEYFVIIEENGVAIPQTNSIEVDVCSTLSFEVKFAPSTGNMVTQVLFQANGDGVDVVPGPGVMNLAIPNPTGSSIVQILDIPFDSVMSANGDNTFTPTIKIIDSGPGADGDGDGEPDNVEICSVEVVVVPRPGLIFLSGDDADDHCDSQNPAPDKNCLHYPAGILSYCLTNANPGCGTDVSILAIGVNEITPGVDGAAKVALDRWIADAPNGPNAVFGLGNVVLDIVDSVAEINNVDFSQYRLVYVPSVDKAEGGEVTGGITAAQLAALAGRKADLENYVYNLGGSLYSQTQAKQDAAHVPWDWLPQAYINDLDDPNTFFDFGNPPPGQQDTFQDNCERNLSEVGGGVLISPGGLNQAQLDLFISHEEWHNTFFDQAPSIAQTNYGLDPLPGAIQNGGGVRLVIRDLNEGAPQDCQEFNPSLIGGTVRSLNP